MSLTMFLVLVGYILMCGAIAYVGDVLGRKMGKKRISIFGLRPRHTAVLITSLVGGVIALSTIYFMITLNAGFRDLVTQGYDKVVELKRTTQQAENQRVLLGQLQRTVGETQAKYRDAMQKSSKADEEYRNIGAELKVAETNLTETQDALSEATQRLRQKQLEVRNLMARRDILKANLTKKNEAIKGMNATMNGLRAQISAQRTRFDDLKRQTNQLSSYNAEISTQNLDLTRTNETLSHDNTMLAGRNHALATTNSDLTKRNADLSKKAASLGSQTATLASQLERYQTFLDNTYASIREGKITYRSGEEVARQSITCGIPAEEARRLIRQFVAEAGRNAVSRGAPPDARNSRSAIIVPKHLPDGTVVDESASVEALADEISRSTGDVVLVAFAVMNTVAGEPVPIEIRPYRNRLIYTRGEEVAQVKMNTLATSEQLFASLLEFLRQDVRAKAMQAGLIPVQEKEGEFAPIGQVASGEILEVVDRLRSLRGPVYVSAHAASNIYAGGPLKLTLRVRTEFK